MKFDGAAFKKLEGLNVGILKFFLSIKAFWDLFTGEITHEYTCTSCKNTSQNLKPIDYLLLKFPDEYHECDLNCTVEYLLQYNLQEEKIDDYQCKVCDKITSAMKKVCHY